VTIPTEITDEELLAQFEDTSLPTSLFDHRQHVRVAWLYVMRHGMPGALTVFSAALQRFAIAKGAHTLFHVTVTWAYLFVINQRQQECAAGTWDAFANQNADLLRWKPSILDRYYTADVLWSDRARQTFVMPDRGHTR
jgi:hypothetical protein